MTQIMTHRGLDPSQSNYFFESSQEAFQDQLDRGYGLEYDVRVTADGHFVITHDKDVKRISDGVDQRLVSEATMEEIKAFELNGCHLTDLDTLCSMIAQSEGGSISALHLKYESQVPEVLDAVVDVFQKYDLFERCIVFDTKIETAKFLKEQDERFHIAPSVAHEYDIERYNEVVGETLYSVDEAIEHKDIFDWVWLDEWDRTDRDGGKKSLYTADVFTTLRSEGFKIGLVAPELHASSPGLLGGEAHQDAEDIERLGVRLKEIVLLGPDAMCTDYPDRVSECIDASDGELNIVSKTVDT